MSQTTYNRDRAKAVPGMMSKDFNGSMVVSYPAAEDIPPGRIVVLNSSSKVELPQATTFSKPVGISVFSPSNQQPDVPAAGYVYKSGDMVPCLRKGRAYVSLQGGTPTALTQALVNHSSTVATHRGKVSASATATTAGSEISQPGPVKFIEVGPTGVWLCEVDFAGAQVEKESSFGVPLASFLDADGDPLAKFVDGASAVPGFNLADSEALNIRWNNHAAPNVILGQCDLPKDLDDTKDMVLEFLVSKSGATLADATTLLVAAFILKAGDLHDADADAGGTTGAVVGNAAAKTTTLLTRTIAAADIPAGARSMTFTVKPTDGTLGTDDFMIHSIRARYTARIQTS